MCSGLQPDIYCAADQPIWGAAMEYHNKHSLNFIAPNVKCIRPIVKPSYITALMSATAIHAAQQFTYVMIPWNISLKNGHV